MRKNLLKKVSIFETAGIVFPKGGKVWNLVHHIQAKETPVGDIYFDFLYHLTHASYAIQVLDEWQLDMTKPVENRMLFSILPSIPPAIEQALNGAYPNLPEIYLQNFHHCFDLQMQGIRIRIPVYPVHNRRSPDKSHK